MRWIRRIVVVLTVLLVALVGFSFTLPESTRVERRVVIDAPAATVFAQLNDFRQFQRWSPWADIAPDVTTTEYDGPTRGVGAKMRWRSEDNRVGSGSQEITVSEPYSRLETALTFDDFGENTAGFELAEVAGGTQITWWLHQEHGMSPAGRYIGLMLDQWVGPDYERGLERLKTQVEALPAADFSALNVSEVVTDAAQLLAVEATSAPNSRAISEALSGAFFQLVTAMGEYGLAQNDRPVRIDRVTVGTLVFDAAIPVAADATPPPADSAVRLIEGYQGPALKVVHQGSYGSLSDAHAQLSAYIAALGYEQAGDRWERYVSDPGNVAEADLITEIYQPIAR